ncbi:hypothetical protein [Bacteroides sp.]|uniref:hypothetical protein n=1 Tax=Bacteroides sp. TaxID=29523 RepID=UPI00260F41C0|nr:hypothetical protein [Bacteroides sp.]MDD3040020.1 hypothetical protein [Bacteroides sp.]
MAESYINKTGLSYFYGRLLNIFQTKTDANTSLGTKVDKIDGKGLSTNDYTTTEKTKLGGVSTGAQVNVIETVKVNGVSQTVTTKAVNLTVPTNTTQLTNGSDFQTGSQVQSSITTALSGITGISFDIVASLPTTGVNGTIYLLANSGAATNIYDEFIYIDSKWEKIGTTDVDLSGYWAKADLSAITTAEIDTITA